MGTAGEENLWVEWISTSPLHLSSSSSLHHCCCCAYVLNNNHLSGSLVGQKLWWREHTRAEEVDREMDGSRRGNEVRLHGHKERHTFLCLAEEEIGYEEKGGEWFTAFSQLRPEPASSFSRISASTGWLSGGHMGCSHRGMPSAALLVYLQ